MKAITGLPILVAGILMAGAGVVGGKISVITLIASAVFGVVGLSVLAAGGTGGTLAFAGVLATCGALGFAAFFVLGILAVVVSCLGVKILWTGDRPPSPSTSS